MKSKKFQDSFNKNYEGISELWAIERNLKKYNSYIVKLISENFSNKLKILEFGGGLGTLALEWKRVNKVLPDCVEIDPNLLEILEARGVKCYKDINDVTDKYDVIYSSNVLEHIEDDRGALDILHSKIKDGGYIAIYVPAFMSLYSKFDEKIGHYRRYEKSELIEKLKQSEFKIIDYKYTDSVGFLIWKLLKSLNLEIDSYASDEGKLKFYDKYIFPVSRYLDELLFSRLYGKNILVVAQKK